MEKNHPLKFFIDFVELKPLKAWEAEFYRGAIPEYDSKEARNLGYIVSLKPNSEGGEDEFNLYFKDFLENKFIEQKTLAIQAIDIELMGMTDVSRVVAKLNILLATTESAIAKIKDYGGATNYPFISTCYDGVYRHLENLLESCSKALSTPIDTSRTMKVKWLANKNVLAQLFVDLAYGQNGEPPFIEIEQPLLRKFIAAHFVDEKGREISGNTIEKYFRPFDKERKRTKPASSFVFPPFKKNKSKA